MQDTDMIGTEAKIAHRARVSAFAIYLPTNPAKSCRVDGSLDVTTALGLFPAGFFPAVFSPLILSPAGLFPAGLFPARSFPR